MRIDWSLRYISCRPTRFQLSALEMKMFKKFAKSNENRLIIDGESNVEHVLPV